MTIKSNALALLPRRDLLPDPDAPRRIPANELSTDIGEDTGLPRMRRPKRLAAPNPADVVDAEYAEVKSKPVGDRERILAMLKQVRIYSIEWALEEPDGNFHAAMMAATGVQAQLKAVLVELKKASAKRR